MERSGASSGTAGLTLAAIGVVYGDIGTSPLYALKEVFSGSHGITFSPDSVIGVVSVILWALTVIVSIKYVSLILRADNRGEGGVMAMMALASSAVGRQSRWRGPVILCGLLGAALFYGDGVITPAISVLSAVEGLEVATPLFSPYVVWITVAVLIGLYAVQRKGTASIGAVFGPIMALWFISLAVIGISNIVREPRILLALNPFAAVDFLAHHPVVSFIALSAIVLALTGAEALYADLGHFGRRPIRLAWFGVIFPSLALAYLGQGALLLAEPEAYKNPFFLAVPGWAIYPLVILATAATVIASQATISGVYSMTKQAIQLGFLPRMRILHTSVRQVGQIYLPMVNWVQFALVIAAVIGFGSSTNLASAYGVAVTGTMLITTAMTFFVIRFGWGYGLALCIPVTLAFATVDLLFFSATLLKVSDGGWFPLLLGLLMFAVMTTWKGGREIVTERIRAESIPLDAFLPALFISPPTRVSGTAVFLRGDAEGVPRAMLHNLSHNKVLHERVFFLTVHYHEVPWVAPGNRVRVVDLGNDCWQFDIDYGFKDEPDVPAAIEAACQALGMPFESMETSFFMSRQTLIPTVGNGGMADWREKLFAMMARNAGDAADYFKLPTNRVIELGAQIEI
jgi:KUP system potassium uptake protein